MLIQADSFHVSRKSQFRSAHSMPGKSAKEFSPHRAEYNVWLVKRPENQGDALFYPLSSQWLPTTLKMKVKTIRVSGKLYDSIFLRHHHPNLPIPERIPNGLVLIAIGHGQEYLL